MKLRKRRTATDPELLRDLARLVGSRARAATLLDAFPLAAIPSTSLAAFEHLLPPTSAARLHAAVRFARACLLPTKPAQLLSAEHAFLHFAPYFLGVENERMVVACCDSHCRPIHTEVVAEGAPNTVYARATDVFAPAVRIKAVRILVAHNHPSLDPTPSAADLRMTEDLQSAAEILQIELVDHLVVAGADHRSLREVLIIRGRWRSPSLVAAADPNVE